MTFNPAAAISILGILKHAELPDKNLAVDFGSQRYTAHRILEANSTRDFYLQNGFKEYRSYDVNDHTYNTKCDLNEPISFENQASLVTNIGTGEHIFDQCSVLTNMHNLCKVGGIMFFHLPFMPWPNHGFYNYNPILFDRMAHANKYELLMLEVGDREGNLLPLAYEEIVKEHDLMLLQKSALEAQLPQFVYAAFRKKLDEPFRKPFQGRYVKDIKDDKILQRYV